VGGASRNERKRRQEAANARLSKAGITPSSQQGGGGRRRTVIVLAALALALVVGMVVAYIQNSGERVAAVHPVTVDGAVVTAGQADAPVTVDIYSDYLCPACERFDQRHGNELTTALNEGRITVDYHLIAILDERSDPPGYSTRAANAASCAATAEIFPEYQARLFDEQPSEGSAGLGDEQLVAFGQELGAGDGFAECVTGGAATAAVASATSAAVTDPALQNEDGAFGTPTVTVDGTRIDIGDTGWLQDALEGS
jgi:protein-disulfide isomerase